MTEFNITERTEPFTIEEVFDFIDDTNISKIDAHELKSRIADVIQAERSKVIDDFAEKISLEISESFIWSMLVNCENYNVTSDKIFNYVIDTVKKIAEGLKGGAIDG